LVVGNNVRKSTGDKVPGVFLLERVGFQADGMAQQPRSPHYPGAKCLTAGGHAGQSLPDRKDGTALGWDTCQDLTVIDAITDYGLLERQSFKLKDDGSIAAAKTGQCVRRMKCEEGGEDLGYMYDLGDCRDDMNLKIMAKKSQANSIEHLRDMGYLSHAVLLENCTMCGPYQLLNMCLGGADCGGSWQAKPGWTKLASQYVGIDAVTGHSEYGNNAGGVDERAEVLGLDLSGIGPTRHAKGLCGSFATDSPTMSSFFYILQAEKNPNR